MITSRTSEIDLFLVNGAEFWCPNTSRERGAHLAFRDLQGDLGQWEMKVHQDPRGAGEVQEVR